MHGDLAFAHRDHEPDDNIRRDITLERPTPRLQKFSERFEREARTIASVNHPNVCHLHNVGPDLPVNSVKGDKAKFIPGKTYKDKVTLGAGKDRIDLYYFGRGHTDGDTFVVFRALRTMHTGDMFAWKALPYIDPDNGGSVCFTPARSRKRSLPSRSSTR